MREGAGAGGRRRATPLHEDLCALGALSGAAVLLTAWTMPLWLGGWQVPCPFRAITGIPCPTCYGTRAVLAVMGGDWRAGLLLNPLVAGGTMALFAYVPWAAATALWGWPRPHPASSLLVKLAWAGAAAVLVNWLYLVRVHG